MNVGVPAGSGGGAGPLLGHLIHGHEIVRMLGAGGMGEVYLAREQSLGALRVIKVIHDDHRENEQARKRFAVEAMSLSHLQHTNIVQVIDYGRLDNGWPFLLMEYIDGPNLDDEIDHKGPRSIPETLTIVAQIAAALDYAHRAEVVHRDLKPGNVLLRHGDPRQVKVIDYGLARVLSQDMVTRLTADRQIMGSPQFMAPEQATGALDVGP